MSRHLPIVAMLGTLAAAFASGCESTPGTVTLARDSAGVRVVESFGPRWSQQRGWTVLPDPLLDLTTSGTGPEHEFHQVTDATLLPDRRIVVANRGTAQLRLYSAQGQAIGTARREGDGPGDFRRLSMVAAGPGDSILAFDYWLGRLTVLSSTLRVGRVVTKPPAMVRLQELTPLDARVWLGVLPDFVAMERTAGLTRVSNILVRLSPSLSIIDTIAVVPGAETFVFETGDARPVLGRQTFVRVHQGRIVVGTANGLGYQIYSEKGKLEEIVRVRRFDLSLSDAVVRAKRAARLPANAPQRVREIEQRLPDPTERPGYSDMIVDETGHVWLKWYPTRTEGDEELSWQVCDPSGAWLGGVRLPARFTVFEIGPDYVLGQRLDDLGVSHVQLLSLHRTAG